MELYRRLRPTKFNEVIGQPMAVRILTDLVKKKNIPHAIAFTGASGCGKTTLARILVTKLGCNKEDFCEINAADARGIDTIREIRSHMGYAPMQGSCRIWLIDEAHRLTSDSQSALLKMLEDCPDHVYFMLATTDENKLLPTIRTRCTEIRLISLPQKPMEDLITGAAKKEGIEVSKELLKQLIECADGSARKALVLLEQIAGIEDEAERIDAVQKADSKRDAIEIARSLINPKATWQEIAAIIKRVEDDPEKIRRMILGYASAVLLNGTKISPNAYLVISCFETDFFASGKAGLVRACYEVCSRRK